MGADLCGFIMCGPKQLDKKKVEKARKWLAKVVAQAKKKDTQGRELKRLLDYGNVVEQYDVEAVAGMGTLLDDFLRVWDDGCFRDQMSRDFPFKKGWQIVVAGEQTWGDGPEPESAWGISERASTMGLFEMLGIE